MEHHADRAIAALHKSPPSLGERAKREVMRHEARDIDLAVRKQRQRAAGHAFWICERDEHVQIPEDDGREVDARELDAGPRRPTEDHAAPAARQTDRVACGFGRARELNDEIGRAAQSSHIRGIDHLVRHVTDTREPAAAGDERDPTGAERARQLRHAESDRARADDDHVLATRHPAALERPEGHTEVVGPRPLLEGDVLREHVKSGDRYRRVFGETAADREANMGVARLSLAVVLTERVHPLAAAVAGAAPDVHLDSDPGARPETLVIRDGDLSGELMPRHVREPGGRKLSRQYFPVGRADHRRPHAHEDLARSCARGWHFADRELVWGAEDDGEHRPGDLRRTGGIADRALHVRGRPGKRSMETSWSSGSRSTVGASAAMPKVNVPRNVQDSGTLRIFLAFSVIQCCTKTPP